MVAFGFSWWGVGGDRIRPKREIWLVLLQYDYQPSVRQMLTFWLTLVGHTSENVSDPPPRSPHCTFAWCRLYTHHWLPIAPITPAFQQGPISCGPITPGDLPLGQSPLKTAVVWLPFKHSLGQYEEVLYTLPAKRHKWSLFQSGWFSSLKIRSSFS